MRDREEKEGIDFFTVRIDAERCRQAERRIHLFTGIRQSLAETFISFAVGLCVADITDEARKGASLLEQMAGDAADTGAALHEKQVAVQLIRGNKRGSVQEHFRNLCLCEQAQKTLVVHIQNDDAVNISVCKSRREKIRFIRRSRKIRVNEIDIVCRKYFCNLVDDGHPEK